MPDAIGRPGELMMSCLASLMNSSEMVLEHGDVTRLESVWIFGIV